MKERGEMKEVKKKEWQKRRRMKKRVKRGKEKRRKKRTKRGLLEEDVREIWRVVVVFLRNTLGGV